jgi:hypothetical protein
VLARVPARVSHKVRSRTSAFTVLSGRQGRNRVAIAQRDCSHPDRPVVDSDRGRAAQADPFLFSLWPPRGRSARSAGVAQARLRPLWDGDDPHLPARRPTR